MALDRMKVEFDRATKAVADQVAANAKAVTDFDTLTADVAKLRDTLGKVSAAEKPDLEKRITETLTKITNAELATMMSAGIMTTLNNTLTAATTARDTAMGTFETKRIAWEATLQSEKDKLRGDANDRFQDSQNAMYEVEDMLARYVSQNDQAKIDEFTKIVDDARGEFDRASREMDRINAEEAKQAEAERFEEEMRMRAEREDERMHEVDDAQGYIDELSRVMLMMEDEISFLLGLNKGSDITPEDKEANVLSVSALRENYFMKMDEQTAKYAELEELI